jgi:hypothetical protein
MCLFSIPASSDVDVDGVVKIEIGKNRGSSQTELWNRVWMLERAVAQLQEKVFELQMRRGHGGGGVIIVPNPGTNPKEMTTCYIKTPFNGTFTATEATETAAKAKVMQDCANKASSIHCGEDDVKCGR